MLRDPMKPRTPAPIGIGTPDVEALSSYIQRLACWHQTLPGQLLHRYLAHVAVNDATYLGRWRRRTGVVRLHWSLNGFGHADAWLRVLEAVTRRSELRGLTTRNWDDTFGPRNLLAQSLRWCPQCLRSDARPYHRLIWLMQPTAVCLRHGCRLAQRCPKCERPVAVIHERSTPTTCPWCASSILLRSTLLRSPEPEEMMIARQLGSLPANPPIRPRQLMGPRLRAICKKRGVPHPAFLARLLGTGKVTCWGWWNGNVAPSLPWCLRICSALCVDFLEAHCRAHMTSTTLPSSHQLSFAVASRRGARQHDWSEIRKLLATEARAPRMHARSLLAIASFVEIAPRTLRVHEPDLCRTIGRNYRAKMHSLAENSLNKLEREITRALGAAAKRGLPISQRIIGSILGKPGIFSRPTARRRLAMMLSDHAGNWPQQVTFPALERFQ